LLLLCSLSVRSQKIDRKALVLRHNIVVTKVDSLSSITLGNGKFAFTTDVTGLQTFPLNYQKSAPLTTEAAWGWYSFIDTADYKRKEVLNNERDRTYSVQKDAAELNKKASERLHQNRLQLGNIGFEINKKDGSLATLSDVQSVYQELNLWTGKLRSRFTIEGLPVEVTTYSSGTDDAIGVKIRSPLITESRLKIKLLFPYSAGQWTNEDKHESKLLMSHDNGAVVLHQLDTTKYYVGFKWEDNGSIEQKNLHYFLIAPDSKTDWFDLTAKFTVKKDLAFLPTFTEVKASSEILWKNFWSANKAIRFLGSAEEKKLKAERKTVRSQYLLKTEEGLKKNAMTALY
jgi:hypothetical protein